MAKRILSSIIFLPIIIVGIAMGGYVLQMGLMVLSIIGMFEFYRVISKKVLPIHFIGYGFTVLYFLMLSKLTSFGFLALLALFVVCLLVYLVIFHLQVTIVDCGMTLFGFFYVALMMSFIYLVRVNLYGQFFVWMIFICAWGCDTGAYFVGTMFGKHKLAPILSPKKTVEGAIGGVVAAFLMAVLYGNVVHWFVKDIDVSLVVFCGVIGIVGSIFAQFGDLAASAIKRRENIKDYGTIIPGHGGIVDRFDSIFVTAPIVYVVMFVLMNYLA